MVSDMVDDQIDTVGKAFMGLTLGCARCHDHKFDPISQADYYALAGMFYSTRILKELGTKGGEYTLNRVPLVPKEVIDETRGAIEANRPVLNAKLAELDKKVPKPPPMIPTRQRWSSSAICCKSELLPEPPLAEAAQRRRSCPADCSRSIQDVPLHIRGSYTRLGPVVPRGCPSSSPGTSSEDHRAAAAGASWQTGWPPKKIH